MTEYKIEIHAHNYEESCDSWLTGKELLDAVKEENYDGILISNHYDNLIFSGMLHQRPCYSHEKSQKDCLVCPLSNFMLTDKDINHVVQCMYEQRKSLQEYANSIGIKVYFGIEWENLTTADIPQIIHLLLFGQTNEEFIKNPPPLSVTTDNLLKWKLKTNSTVILNHCNRFEKSCNAYMFYDNEELIDGFEVYNSKNNEDKHTPNDISDFLLSHVTKNRYDSAIHLSGGDIHKKEHLGKSGIILTELPEDERGLQQLILNKKYSFII